jgi:hypothetical protein
MEQGEFDLSDVQKFLNSDDVDSFISGDREEGGDVYIDGEVMISISYLCKYVCIYVYRGMYVYICIFINMYINVYVLGD